VTEGNEDEAESQTRQTGAAKAIKDIRRATRKQYSAEEKIRIVLDGLRGEVSIAEQPLELRLLKKSMIADGGDDE
jgi:hypothetical protein|tara:strand:- start:1 stop:225 length:225 start_codon:yes stop_codon:yes gene_type:complete